MSHIAIADPFLAPQSVVTLEFGDAPSKLGSSGFGEDDWKLLFFSVGADDTIAVPDINKGRIALYSAKGVFIKAIPVTAAISSRMNFFAQSLNDNYVSFNDGALYSLTASGEVLWRAPFPMGVFPKALYAGGEAVYFAVEEIDGVKSFSIPYIPPFTATESVVVSDGGNLPRIRVSGFVFGYTAADTARLRTASGGTFSLSSVPAKARFLEAEKSGRAVWLEKEEDAYAVYNTTSDGKLIASGRIARAPSASWYWVVAKFDGDGASIYLCEDGRGSMRIEMYRLK